jgi:hypothetical protein
MEPIYLNQVEDGAKVFEGNFNQFRIFCALVWHSVQTSTPGKFAFITRSTK